MFWCERTLIKSKICKFFVEEEKVYFKPLLISDEQLLNESMQIELSLVEERERLFLLSFLSSIHFYTPHTTLEKLYWTLLKWPWISLTSLSHTRWYVMSSYNRQLFTTVFFFTLLLSSGMKRNYEIIHEHQRKLIKKNYYYIFCCCNWK